MTKYTTEIIKAYRTTTPGQRKRGRSWYPNAHKLCRTLAQAHGLEVKQTAGILAALSPMCNWNLNVLGLICLVKTHRLPAKGTYNANRLKAWRILEGEKPARVLGGPKVKSFYANILRPHGDAVTIDRWICKVVGLEPKKAEQTKHYNQIADAIRTVAKRLHLTPSRLQATIWIGIRDGVPDDHIGETLPLWEA